MEEHGGELEHMVGALADGDAGFALAFVERFGDDVARELAHAGVAARYHDDLVHDVALALVGRPRAGDAWTTVRLAVIEVLVDRQPPTPARPRPQRPDPRIRGGIGETAGSAPVPEVAA